MYIAMSEQGEGEGDRGRGRDWGEGIAKFLKL